MNEGCCPMSPVLWVASPAVKSQKTTYTAVWGSTDWVPLSLSGASELKQGSLARARPLPFLGTRGPGRASVQLSAEKPVSGIDYRGRAIPPGQVSGGGGSWLGFSQLLDPQWTLVARIWLGTTTYRITRLGAGSEVIPGAGWPSGK